MAADFHVLKAGTFTLDAATPLRSTTFNLPANPSGAVLLYGLDTDGAAGPQDWRIRINTTQIASYELADQGFRSLHEVVPPGAFIAGAPNTIEFQLNTAAGAGPLSFRDVVLLVH